MKYKKIHELGVDASIKNTVEFSVFRKCYNQVNLYIFNRLSIDSMTMLSNSDLLVNFLKQQTENEKE